MCYRNKEEVSVQSYNTVRTTPTPPETTITSAVDGNGSTITNGSTTFSGSIRFTFTATAGTNPVASFECSLDNSVFSTCSSPATSTNLAPGKHTFQVRAVDTLGNRDPTPSSFSWTIATVTPPTKTAITSAADGNNAPIQNGGTTSSNSIKIAFSATAGTNPIAGFQCSLDNSPFSSYTSPTVFNNLAAGPHKFTLIAVDTAGNKDPKPAIFSWAVGAVTPTQSIQQLIHLKHSMHLSPATDQTLDTRLNIALQFAQHNIKSGTCVQLTVFIKLVQAELRGGHVTSVQATQLIQAAQKHSDGFRLCSSVFCKWSRTIIGIAVTTVTQPNSEPTTTAADNGIVVTASVSISLSILKPVPLPIPISAITVNTKTTTTSCSQRCCISDCK
jgi:hypothetical protein